MTAKKNTFPNARILVVDDNIENVRITARLLEWAGYFNVEVMTNPQTALTAIFEFSPDLILLDLHMPGLTGYEILEAIRAEGSSRSSVPVLVFTADSAPEAKARAFEAGASDFLTKPGDAQEIILRVRNFLEMRRLHLHVANQNAELEDRVRVRTEELARARQEALQSLALAGEFRDDETGNHTKRVGHLSSEIARTLEEGNEFVESLRLAAPLHDIGKVGISDAILLKPGRYSEDEFLQMQEHTLIGAKILEQSESPLMTLAREIALSHHERWDGTGYPHHLEGEAIPLSARIVAVADVYDALTSERPYKAAWTHFEAVQFIESQAGKQFDPRVVAAFLAIMHPLEINRAA